jgi:hypothetical protein
VARFSDPAQKRMLEEAGAHPIAFDLGDPDLSPLPESVENVLVTAIKKCPTQRQRQDSRFWCSDSAYDLHDEFLGHAS